jgi:transcriptional regulator NrdR family protein
MSDIHIIKRDGAQEVFEINKIYRVLKAAGLPEDQTKKVIENVEAWISERNLNEFKSIELKDKILKELQMINPQIAGLYQWYESTKDPRKD